MKKIILLFAIFLLFISCKSIPSGEKFTFHLTEGSQKLLVKKSVSVFENGVYRIDLLSEFLMNRNIYINDDSILVNKDILDTEEKYKKGLFLEKYSLKYNLKTLSPDYYAVNSITGEVISEYDSTNYNPVVKTLIDDFYMDKEASVPIFLSLFDYSFSCKDDNLTILFEDDNIENISKLMCQTTDFDFSESEYKNYLLNSEYSLNELTAETFNEYQFTIKLLNDKTFQMYKEYPFVYELRLKDNKKPIYIPTSFQFWKSYDPTEFAVKGGCDFYDSRKIPALPESIKKIFVGYFIRCTKELKIIECVWTRSIIYNDNGREIPVTYRTEYKITN